MSLVRDLNDHEIVVESGLMGHPISVAVQHSGNLGQSTGLMFFGGKGEILSELSGDDFAELIVKILERWKGKHPDRFQEIKALL